MIAKILRPTQRQPGPNTARAYVQDAKRVTAERVADALEDSKVRDLRGLAKACRVDIETMKRALLVEETLRQTVERTLTARRLAA